MLLVVCCFTIDDKQPTIKGSLKNNFTFWAPMHPVRLCCENPEYPDIPAFSRLAAGRLNTQNCEHIFREP
jgi:hypothetical protein